MRRIAARLAVIAALLAGARAARADDDDEPQLLRMQFVESGDQLLVSTIGEIPRLFDEASFAALGKGTPTTVEIQIQITARDSELPIAQQIIQRTVFYDVWDEGYKMHFEQPGGHKDLVENRSANALKRLTKLDSIPVAPLSMLPIDQVFVLKMLVKINPVSEKTLAEVRRWLSKGTSGGIDRGGALFGSFVSVFYNPKISDADRVLRIRSQPFYRPAP